MDSDVVIGATYRMRWFPPSLSTPATTTKLSPKSTQDIIYCFENGLTKPWDFSCD